MNSPGVKAARKRAAGRVLQSTEDLVQEELAMLVGEWL